MDNRCDRCGDRLGSLIDMIVETAPDALVVVASVTPLTFSTNLVDAYNDAVPDVVAERAEGVTSSFSSINTAVSYR